MLDRSGGRSIPPCQYFLPNNATELELLTGALKSVELGVFISLADSLPPTDTLATILLSNIATVSAKQKGLLYTETNPNATLQPFETVASETWAYNFVSTFVQPGSCALDLPVPILPMLTVNNKTITHAQPGTNVTIGWDVAGRAAASRSGKPLFVAWVNQVNPPLLTRLTTLGDGWGTTKVPLGLLGTAFAVLTAQPEVKGINELTDATLAGPIFFNIGL